MRYIKKYNESKIDGIVDYIKMAFAELTDNEVDSGVDVDPGAAFIYISIPTLHEVNQKLSGGVGDISTSISKMIDNNKKVLSIYEDIETAINRVIDEYPETKFNIFKPVEEVRRGDILSYLVVEIKWDLN